MSYVPSYKAGDFKAVCDQCGKVFKASQLRKTWEGLMVCSVDFETRHPQDYVSAKEEKISVPWTRTEQPDTFQTPDSFYCEEGYAYSEVSIGDVLNSFGKSAQIVQRVDINHPFGYVNED